MNVAFVLELWELPIYERIISEADYDYFVIDGVTPDSFLLSIRTDDLVTLATHVQRAQNESAISRMH